MAENNVFASFSVFDNSVAVITDSSSSLDYFFRYRLITDEGDAITQWSEINNVTQESISGILDGFSSSVSASSVESGGTAVNISWTTPKDFPTNRFDVYLSWSSNNGLSFTSFEYADTVTSNSYSAEIPLVSSVKATLVKVAIQVPTNIKIINTNALLVQSDALSARPVLDSGQIMV
jgi:hypothetical protein